MMDQKRRHERSELTVTASYRRKMSPQTLKHTVPTTSDSPTTHYLHKESHLEPACTPKRNHTGNTRRDLQPTMPSFGERRLKIAASNLPTRDQQPYRKSAPPPEKRLQVDKKVESTSEAYPSPQNQSTSSLDQTALSSQPPEHAKTHPQLTNLDAPPPKTAERQIHSPAPKLLRKPTPTSHTERMTKPRQVTRILTRHYLEETPPRKKKILRTEISE
ncbi:hypothetical protein YC2023_011387 [Brassica napus]